MKRIKILYLGLLISITSQAQNQAPQIAAIPNQVAANDGTFLPLDLNSYLTEPDGNPVQWSFYQTNTLSNGEHANWNYSNKSPSMTMLARINVRGEFPTDAQGDKLVAFHDDDIKGLAPAISLGPNYWLFFLTIDGDQAGDTISFKYFDASQSAVFEIDHKVRFVSQQTFGSPSSPYVMNAGYMTVLDEGLPNTGLLFPRAYTPAWAGVDTFYVVAQELGTVEGYSDTAMVIFASNGYILPLDLLSFTGEYLGRHAELKWEIENAENVAYFELQHARTEQAIGDRDWQTLENIVFDQFTRHYQYIHRFPSTGHHYYRLKIVDLDGSHSYSEVISLQQSADIEVNVHPNPTAGVFRVQLQMSPENIERITIVNTAGELVRQKEIDPNREVDTFYDFDFSSLPAGMYLLSVFGQAKVKTKLLSLNH